MTQVSLDMLKKVKEPVETARGLPNEFYTDADVFAAEKRVAFAKTWSCIGFGKDVAAKGAAVPVEFLGQPLLIVRDQDMNIRVFQNVCRHRGMILVEEPTTLRGVIRCPYHSWCYDLNGALRTTPHVGGPGQNMHECIKRDELGLLEIRSHVFMDMIWVNLSGDAADFKVHNSKLLDRWSEYVEQPLFHGGETSSFKLDLKTNWKLAVENYCESYHLPWIHPGAEQLFTPGRSLQYRRAGHILGPGDDGLQPETGRQWANVLQFCRARQQMGLGCRIYCALSQCAAWRAQGPHVHDPS